MVILWRLQQAGSLRGRYRFHTTVIEPGASSHRTGADVAAAPAPNTTLDKAAARRTAVAFAIHYAWFGLNPPS